MSDLQGVFQENAQILSFKEAFNIKGFGFHKWMTTRKIGVYIMTSETAVHFPLSREGMNAKKDPIDTLKALVGHPALDVAQFEMNRLQVSDRKAIEELMQCIPYSAVIAGNKGLMYSFRVIVRAAGGGMMDHYSNVKLSEREHPTFVRDMISKIAQDYK